MSIFPLIRFLFDSCSARSARRIREFLARQRSGILQAAIGNGEYRHAGVVDAVGACIFLPRTRSGGDAVGSRAGIGRRGDRNGARARGKLKAARLELVEGAFVLKKDDLTEVLAAGLKTDAELLHRRIADELPLDIHPAPAERAAHEQSCLADVGKHGIGVALLKESGAFARILEERNRVLILSRV